MRSRLFISFIFSSALILNCCSSSTNKTDRLPYYSTSDFTPQWVNAKDADTIHTIPDFAFIDQNGKIITRQTFDNKITVVDFFFTTCPGICKKLTSSLVKVQEVFKKDNDVILLSHSVTPEKDSVPVLKKYADENGAINNKWHLVTGKRNEIYTIARTAYFADEDMGWKQDSTTFLHTENILLIDKQHHIRGVYKGTIPKEIDDLIADIKKLQASE
jgi:protein SCO1/2